jgi:hypothetical protein
MTFEQIEARIRALEADVEELKAGAPVGTQKERKPAEDPHKPADFPAKKEPRDR